MNIAGTVSVNAEDTLSRTENGKKMNFGVINEDIIQANFQSEVSVVNNPLMLFALTANKISKNKYNTQKEKALCTRINPEFNFSGFYNLETLTENIIVLQHITSSIKFLISSPHIVNLVDCIKIWALMTTGANQPKGSNYFGSETIRTIEIIKDCNESVAIKYLNARTTRKAYQLMNVEKFADAD